MYPSSETAVLHQQASQDVFEEDEYSEEDENENCSEADDLIDLIALNQEDLRESQDELVIQKLRQEEQEDEEDNNESDEEQETMDQDFALTKLSVTLKMN